MRPPGDPRPPGTSCPCGFVRALRSRPAGALRYPVRRPRTSTISSSKLPAGRRPPAHSCGARSRMIGPSGPWRRKKTSASSPALPSRAAEHRRVRRRARVGRGLRRGHRPAALVVGAAPPPRPRHARGARRRHAAGRPRHGRDRRRDPYARLRSRRASRPCCVCRRPPQPGATPRTAGRPADPAWQARWPISTAGDPSRRSSAWDACSTSCGPLSRLQRRARGRPRMTAWLAERFVSDEEPPLSEPRALSSAADGPRAPRGVL